LGRSGARAGSCGESGRLRCVTLASVSTDTQFRFAPLLVALLSIFFLLPLFGGRVARIAAVVVLSGIMFAALFAVSRSGDGRLTKAGVALLIPTLLLKWAGEWGGSHMGLLVTKQVAVILLLWLTTACLLVLVFRATEVTTDTILGAIAVYLLMGVAWAPIYSLIEILQPGSFGPKVVEGEEGSFFYFSYVTLSTLGYGDISPRTAPARAFATLEAIAGQFYLAVLVARLVSLQLIHASTPVAPPEA
jgi:voltage-gated potassium channel